MSPTEQRLVALRSCLSATDKVSIEDLGLGLLWGWKNWGAPGGRYWVSPWSRSAIYWRAGIEWPAFLVDPKSGRVVPTDFPPPPDSALPDPPPQAYIDSLDRDLDSCAALRALKDKRERDTILEVIARDIQTKAEDCRRFGMGRLIPIRISTVRNGVPENGWEVLYKWASVSAITTTELSIPQLSSPAVVNLPPGGTYLIRAQKSGADGQLKTTETRRITISSAPVIECALPIP